DIVYLVTKDRKLLLRNVRRVIATRKLELFPDLQPRVAAMGTTQRDVKGGLVKKIASCYFKPAQYKVVFL
ncbi:MAG: hypothetical protein PV344_08210, partial [Anaplasma sp.]|nr:hypothetical protein [Anaplasma sp.]